MKPSRCTVLSASVALVVAACCWPRLPLQAQAAPAGSEYATIRWAGRENTHVVRPGGKVEFIGAELRRSGTGRSKKLAEQAAAKEAWEALLHLVAPRPASAAEEFPGAAGTVAHPEP